jgi:Crp-like helix-turn-helix domain
MLAHFGKDGIPETVVLKISQETLAEMVGTTRSRVSFFMNRFSKLGFIDTPGVQKAGYRFTVHFSTSFSMTSGSRHSNWGQRLCSDPGRAPRP